MTPMSADIDILVEGIRKTAAGAAGLLVPVSGGSDSALCFWLCMRAFPEKTVAVHAGTDLRAGEWFAGTGRIEFTEVSGDGGEREEMRWSRFMSMALSRRFWLVGSRNRTEDLLGTYSLASRIATFLPVVGVWKSDVQRLCAEIGVPAELIESSRRADPDCGRPAELAEIPFEAIEAFLRVRGGDAPAGALAGMDGAQVAYLDAVLSRNAFKKELPLRGRKLR